MKNTMQAAVYRGVDEMRVETVPVPDIEAGEVLVRVGACGVCGTDLKKIQYGLVPPPRIFGHETAGTIAAVGAGVTAWQVGDRVALHHHVPCLRDDCFYCRRHVFAQCPTYKRTGTTAGFEPAGGGFAEYVRVMDWCVARGMVRLPDDISFAEASFIEPLNTCLKGVRMAGVQAGDTVWIIGQGPIGLLFTQLTAQAGAHVVVTDPLPFRQNMARKMGAHASFDPAAEALPSLIQEYSEGRGADLVIVAVPTTQVMRQAFGALRSGGKVLLFAHTRLNDPLEVDAGAICMQEKSLLGSYSSDIRLQDEAAQMIFERRIQIDALISHRLPLTAIKGAIEVASHPHETSLKVIVDC